MVKKQFSFHIFILSYEYPNTESTSVNKGLCTKYIFSKRHLENKCIFFKSILCAWTRTAHRACRQSMSNVPGILKGPFQQNIRPADAKIIIGRQRKKEVGHWISQRQVQGALSLEKGVRTSIADPSCFGETYTPPPTVNHLKHFSKRYCGEYFPQERGPGLSLTFNIQSNDKDICLCASTCNCFINHP